MRHQVVASVALLSLSAAEGFATAPTSLRGLTRNHATTGSAGVQCRLQSSSLEDQQLLFSTLQSPDAHAVGTQPLSRRTVLAGVIFGGLGTLIAPIETNAAVPSQAEYEVGSGTLVRPKTAAAKREVYKPPQDKDSALQLVKEADLKLDEFIVLINKMAWDDIRTSLQTIPISAKYVKPDRPGVLMSQYFGLDSVKAVAQALKVDDKTAAAVEKARKEASLAILELADFAFTNKVVFFSAEDKKSVAQLAESNLEVDINEAKEIVDRAKAQVQKIESLLSS